MSTMFFQSTQVNTHWDTWVYEYNGKFYLYYLSEIDGRWAGFGVAVSDNGVVWEDQGVVLTASEKMKDYLGTGSIWKSPTFEKDHKFYVNYSEWQQTESQEKQQRIFFAESYDLIHWRKLEKIFDIDNQLYQQEGRWDCIYPLTRKEGGYFGTWTATPLERTQLNGGIGFGYSENGIDWKVLKNEGIIPPADESGAVTYKSGKYYAMFGCFADGMAMYAYSADQFNGPYVRCEKHNPLLTPGTTYFSRFVEFDGQLLLNHHAISKKKAATGFFYCYMAPLKRVEIEQNNICLKYWEGNEYLKQLGTVKESQFDPKACIFLEGKMVQGESIQIGRHAPLTLELADNQIITREENQHAMHFAIPKDGETAKSETVQIKMLLKQWVLEVYIDNLYVFSYSLAQPFDGTLVASEQTIWEIADL